MTQPDHTDAARLVEFLRERNAPCPSCGYNLRGLQQDRCPECGHRITLRAVRADRSWFAAGVFGLGCGALFASGAFLLLLGLPQSTQAPALAGFGVMMVVNLTVLCLWVRGKKWLAARRPAVRTNLALLCLAYGTLMLLTPCLGWVVV